MQARKIKQLAADLARDDPGTAITESVLRRLVVSGKVYSVRFGRDYLIDRENVERYIHGLPQIMPDLPAAKAESPKNRRVM